MDSIISYLPEKAELSDFPIFQPGSRPRQMQQQEYGDDGPFGGLPSVADHITKEVPKNVGGQKRCKNAGAWVLQGLTLFIISFPPLSLSICTITNLSPSLFWLFYLSVYALICVDVIPSVSRKHQHTVIHHDPPSRVGVPSSSCNPKPENPNSKVQKSRPARAAHKELDMYNRKCTSLHKNLHKLMHKQWHKKMIKARWKKTCYKYVGKEWCGKLKWWEDGWGVEWIDEWGKTR